MLLNSETLDSLLIPADLTTKVKVEGGLENGAGLPLSDVQGLEATLIYGLDSLIQS